MASVVSLFVFARLLQIRAIARTIERHLALFAAALRADSSVDSGTKTLLFSEITYRTAHCLDYFMPDSMAPCAPFMEQSLSFADKSR